MAEDVLYESDAGDDNDTYVAATTHDNEIGDDEPGLDKDLDWSTDLKPPSDVGVTFSGVAGPTARATTRTGQSRGPVDAWAEIFEAARCGSADPYNSGPGGTPIAQSVIEYNVQGQNQYLTQRIAANIVARFMRKSVFRIKLARLAALSGATADDCRGLIAAEPLEHDDEVLKKKKKSGLADLLRLNDRLYRPSARPAGGLVGPKPDRDDATFADAAWSGEFASAWLSARKQGSAFLGGKVWVIPKKWDSSAGLGPALAYPKAVERHANFPPTLFGALPPAHWRGQPKHNPGWDSQRLAAHLAKNSKHKNLVEAYGFTMSDWNKGIAVLLLAGVHGRASDIDSWWGEDHLQAFVQAQDIWTGRKFKHWLRHVHVADSNMQVPKGKDGHEPAFKVQIYLRLMVRCFQGAFNPGREMSFDEMMIAFEGRCYLKQYIKGKPIDRGFKLWATCDCATKYTCWLELYTGKVRGEKQTYHDIVLRNLKDAGLLSKGHDFTMDNLFTSPALFVKLFLEHDTTCTGTARKNRAGMPAGIECPGKRGDAEYTTVEVEGQNGKTCVLSCTLWLDKKPVYVLSTAVEVGPEFETVLEPPAKKGKVGESYNQPSSRKKYVKHMDAVDVADALRSYCGVALKRMKRWWFTLWVGLLDIGITNAYIINNCWRKTRGEEILSTKDFRCQVTPSSLAAAHYTADVKLCAARTGTLRSGGCRV